MKSCRLQLYTFAVSNAHDWNQSLIYKLRVILLDLTLGELLRRNMMHMHTLCGQVYIIHCWCCDGERNSENGKSSFCTVQELDKPRENGQEFGLNKQGAHLPPDSCGKETSRHAIGAIGAGVGTPMVHTTPTVALRCTDEMVSRVNTGWRHCPCYCLVFACVHPEGTVDKHDIGVR